MTSTNKPKNPYPQQQVEKDGLYLFLKGKLVKLEIIKTQENTIMFDIKPLSDSDLPKK